MEAAAPSALWAVLGIAGFLVVFPLFWCAVVALISVLSGWNRLAAQYAVPEFTGTVLAHNATARIGLARYRGVLKVAWSEQGLHLGVMIFFRPLHPPLCIPWRDIASREQRKFLFIEWDVIEVQGVKIALSAPVLGPVANRLPPSKG